MHAWTKNTGNFINKTCNAICHNSPCGKWCGNDSEACNQLGKNWEYCLFRYYENSDDFGQTDPWCGDKGVGGFYKKQADNFNICDRHKQIMMNALGIQN
ncbi:MAG: hypothetical protein EAZ38_13395 [Cytophagales bacterium]|nr:MAG: hypothetical protein EAZ38_13395 [Cytophagales bacterium]